MPARGTEKGHDEPRARPSDLERPELAACRACPGRRACQALCAFDPSLRCSRDESQESLAAFAGIAAPGETLILLQADEFVLPPGFAAAMTAFGVQMLAERRTPEFQDERIEKLGETDAADMLELATLTKPGPFTMKAQALGDFWGIRENGRLIAMAGERLKQEGLTEISGVCTHPDVRGKGLGRLLTLFAAGKIFARGEQPFLHTYAANAVAIGLYESIGFKLRTRMNFAVIERQV